MQHGAVLPTCEIGSDPVAIRDWAQAAEALGYSHLIVYDHVLGSDRGRMLDEQVEVLRQL